MVLPAVALVGLLAGCGREPPPPIIDAEGVVLLEGMPIYNAKVRFIPQIDHGPEFIAMGITDKEGRFKLTCNGLPGACAGENLVVIGEADIPAKLQSENAQTALIAYKKSLGPRPPAKYANLAQSPLTALVTEAQKQFVFALEY
jgi:hypothetical protein